MTNDQSERINGNLGTIQFLLIILVCLSIGQCSASDTNKCDPTEHSSYVQNPEYDLPIIGKVGGNLVIKCVPDDTGIVKMEVKK